MGMTMMSPIPTIWKRVFALLPKKMAIIPAVNAMMKEEYMLFAVIEFSENASTINRSMAHTMFMKIASLRPTRTSIKSAQSAAGRA